jgi:hypothetical protein
VIRDISEGLVCVVTVFCITDVSVMLCEALLSGSLTSPNESFLKSRCAYIPPPMASAAIDEATTLLTAEPDTAAVEAV